MTDPEAAFDILSDPARLPDYVPTLRLEDSIAIEGDADPDADAVMAEREGAPEAGFVADRKTRTITWGRPDRDYRGSIAIGDSTSSTANVTVRLHTRDDSDEAAILRVFDEGVANIRRLLMRR